MAKQFSTRSGSVRRLLQEAKEIANDPSITEFHAAPLEVQPVGSHSPSSLSDCPTWDGQDELFEWHFTIKVPDAEFAGQSYCKRSKGKG